ncbi:tyrosine recombinase XerC [Dysosmobacter sp.]|uniref:site-specific integrase n=1 Tax=Dysosmobacter sp. TaxID=2591382 RepID=UPI002672EFF3|nr:site-specific integrase [Dysosmobacter sp.]MCI7281445.1 site-specific integrase [Dysosmobacter sp.]
MKPRKKGQQYEISYRCPGYSKPFYERFSSYEEANLRIAQIEYEKSLGVFQPPKPVPIPIRATRQKYITVGELMDEYVQVYGLNHWGDSFLSCSKHRIEHYIKPYLGNVAVKDLTTHDLDLFYDSLQDKPAVILKGHKKTDATVSLSVIEKTHALLRSALNQAVKWEYISSNPAERVTLPKYRPAERDVWSASEAQYALDCCSDPVLHTAMLLALGCSMRIGEILGLTWNCVDFSDESIHDGTAHVFVNKELKRCQKDSLEALAHRGRSQVIFTFPEWKQTDSTTSLVLKSPKTESSVRKVYLPRTVALALREVKSTQDALKLLIGDEYADYGLVIAHEDGRPYEERQIAALLRKLIAENDLRPVVFHSLRHCSASLKLQIGGGNIKAVQGDTGHAQARMVTDLYAHTHNEDRRRLAQKVDEDFFQKRPSEAKKAVAHEADLAYQLLQDNPDIAKLIIATLQKKSS